MALKGIMKSLNPKKEGSILQPICESPGILMTSDNFPIVRSADTDMSKYKKIPLFSIASMGAAFAKLPESARIITQTVTRNVATNETLFVGINVKGTPGFLLQNEHGTVGNIMQYNAQGKQIIADRMRFKPLESGLPVSTTTSTVIPFDPFTLVIAAALASIDKKLDTLHEKAEEILQFLKLDNKSRQRGNLDLLSEIMDEYKKGFSNEKMCFVRLVGVQSIKKEALQDIHRYQDLIANKIKEQKLLHGAHKAQELLDSVTNEFYEYQLASYLYAYASFMETMLQRNISLASAAVSKMKKYAQQYADLYSSCYDQITNYQQKAIEAQLIDGLGNAAKSVGNKIAAVPLLNKGIVDEALIVAGESLKKHNSDVIERKLESFTALQDSKMETFIDGIQTFNLIYIDPKAILTDGENLYIMEAV